MTESITGYAVAAAASLAVVAIRFALQPWLGLDYPFVMLILAPLLASFYGLGPALLATLMCAVGAAFLLMEPGLSFSGRTPSGMTPAAGAEILLFGLVGLAISLMGGRRIKDKQRLQDLATETAQTRNHLQSILDSVPACIYQIATDGRYQFVNRAYAELVGRSPLELVGKHVRDVFSAEDADVYLEHNARLFQGDQVLQFEEKTTLADGVHIFTSTKTPLFDARGIAVGLLGVSTDITQRIAMENSLRQSDARKDEFLAVLGHELRNPLAPLYAGIDLLAEVGDKPALLEDIRVMMKRQVSHLLRLVDDLLNMSRISRGIVELHLGSVDINQIVPQALEQVMPVIEPRKLQVDVSLYGSSLMVQGDFDRLTQVVVNLLTNAAKYTEPGGRICIMTLPEETHAVIRVSDTGHGIPGDQLEQIFEMFSQVPEHKVFTGGGGLGIGLALCRQLVHLHDGTIAASSEGPGFGATFTVRLPLDRAPQLEQAPPLARTSEAGNPGSAPEVAPSRWQHLH